MILEIVNLKKQLWDLKLEYQKLHQKESAMQVDCLNGVLQSG